MKIRLNTIEEVITFIAKVDTKLCYPNGKGTETYCTIPEITEIKDENNVVIESYYEIPITQELNDLLIEEGTKQIQNEQINKVV